jgi:hypothetical protein
MSIQITGVDSDFSLEDAIAYEFFMEHVSILFQSEAIEKDELTDVVTKLAKASYTIGAIFSQAREQHIEKTNVEN